MEIKEEHSRGTLLKLRIKGDEEELKQFAFKMMDAIEIGEIRFSIGETDVKVKLDG